MQTHHRVKIAYADYMGETTERFFEPHTLVSATIRGTAKDSAILSTFAIHRIKTAELLKSDFAPNNRF